MTNGKKLCVFLLMALFLKAGYAQEIGESGNDVSADSQQAIIEELSAKLKEAEDEKLNEAIWKKRAKYFHFGYVKQSLKPDNYGDFKWNSSVGFAINWGRTYYLHKKPLFNMVKIGIDWSWMDLNYAKYEKKDAPVGNTYQNDYDEDEDGFDLGLHQLEYGMRIGPSITVNPVERLKIGAYFHFVPSYSLIVVDEEFNHGFVPFFSFGGAVSWRVLTVGVEGRWGKANYNNLSFDDDDDDYGYDDFDYADSGNGYDINPSDVIGGIINKEKTKFQTKSFRVYIGFRF